MARVEKSSEHPVDELGSIESSQDGGVTIVRFVGEIDISNVDALAEKLDGIVREAPGNLVIDLAALEFMDSSGIAMLIRASGSAGSIEIRNPSEVVRRIIECTGLADVLRLES